MKQITKQIPYLNKPISIKKNKQISNNLIFIIASLFLIPGITQTSFAQIGEFVVKVTFLDDHRDGPTYVSLFIKEYPEFSVRNIDLLDAMYDNDNKTKDGQYATEITMPSGLIKDNEIFHVCLNDEDQNKTLECFKMQNNPTNRVEQLVIKV